MVRISASPRSIIEIFGTQSSLCNRSRGMVPKTAGEPELATPLCQNIERISHGDGMLLPVSIGMVGSRVGAARSWLAASQASVR